ncbi:MAG: response regulator [Sandaracinaceae bacterium]|nr:response regulator [Sandaracinaceae bacterium]
MTDPPEGADDEPRPTAHAGVRRTFVILGVSQLVSTGIYLALRGAPETWEAAALAGGLLYPFLLAMVPSSAPPRRLANVGYVLAIIFTGLAAFTTGGVDSPFTPILVVAPTSAFSATGRRGVNALLALALFALGSLFACDALDLTLASTLPAEHMTLIRVVMLAHAILAVGLAGLAVEVTRERTLSKVQRARDEALDAAQARARFLAAISHEIRTPLNGLLGMAQLLRDTPLRSDQHRMAVALERSGITLLALVNQLLDYARIEARGVQLEPLSFEVRELVEDVLEVFAAQAADKGLDLVYTIDAQVPLRATADAARIRQILANLVGNGVKYTAEGLVEVRVRCPEEGVLELQVEDTGPGISGEEAQAVFEPFRRGAQERSAGTGLGLTVSRQLAEAMGGSLTITEGVGSGACFEARVAIEGESEEVTQTALETRLVLKKVRLVDDREHIRRMLESMLASLGARTVTEGADVVIAGQTDEEDFGETPVVWVRGMRSPHDPSALHVTEPVRRSALTRAILAALGSERAVKAPIWQQEAQLAERAPLRILVAEDHPINQQVIQMMLEKLGYRADIVGDGAEAVQRARAGYDVVLMDLQMPILDGIEATRQIVDMKAPPDVIGLSASVTNDVRARCQEIGMADFVDKPVRLPDLAAALVRAAERRHTLKDDAEALIETMSEPPPPPRLADRVDAAIERGEAAVVALGRLKMVAGGDVAKVREMVERYLGNAEELIESIKVAHAEGDAETAERAAHKLKGSSATYGAVETGARAAEVEDGAAPDALEATFERDRDTIREVLESLE